MPGVEATDCARRRVRQKFGPVTTLKSIRRRSSYVSLRNTNNSCSGGRHTSTDILQRGEGRKRIICAGEQPCSSAVHGGFSRFRRILYSEGCRCWEDEREIVVRRQASREPSTTSSVRPSVRPFRELVADAPSRCPAREPGAPPSEVRPGRGYVSLTKRVR